jgi:hypothetical protein
MRRSIKAGIAVSLGIPFAAAFLLVKLAIPLGGANFEGVLFLAVFLWFLIAAAVLVPAAVRVFLRPALEPLAAGPRSCLDKATEESHLRGSQDRDGGHRCLRPPDLD